MNKFTYYSITGKFKETDYDIKEPKNMVNLMEHFDNYDDVEDKLLMVYKTTDVKILDKDDAKKLIEKYLQK
jgi:2-phosphoglycerate kinase